MAKTETERPQMDWQQVALNGGPPCFALGIDAPGWYCGRAQRWDGHDYDHKFVSLDDLLYAERERAVRIIREHRESDKCEGSCWEIISNLIRGKQ